MIYFSIMSGWVHRLQTKDAKVLQGICEFCGPVEIVFRDKGLRCINSKRMRRIGKSGLTQHAGQLFREGKPCAICGSKEKNCVDHDHATGEIRGVLCVTCNIGLGCFKDKPELLQAAKEYLSPAGTST